MESIELLRKIRQIKEAQKIVDYYNGEVEGLKDEIKQHMITQGVDEMDVDIFKVRYTNVTTNRFDSTEFKKTHEQLYSQYCKESTSKRFSIA